MIVFVLESRTPHHNPVLDRLAARLSRPVQVFYVSADDSARGWGTVEPSHSHSILRGRTPWWLFVRALTAPDLEAVCLFGYRGAARIAAAVVARLRRVPLVMRSDSNVSAELRRSRSRRAAKRWYLRMLLGEPEIWSVGTANEAYWRLLGFRRLRHIPFALPELPDGESGASATRATLGVRDRFVFVFVGRLEPIKGVDLLLGAYDIVRDKVRDGATALVVVGGGSLAPDVAQHCATRADCHYLGPIDHGRLGAVFAAADVAVVPSRTDAWGLVVNEALGFGTPVIATVEVAAANDLVTPENGRRCPADVVGLADAMLAEYHGGPRRVPRLVAVDVAAAMAERLDRLNS
ncbi:glycosyltransferase [Micromonospora sp. DT31]|uniref:glycosyltransferase n=1 Tax=Micromonospora sp. DT31 TaxID=3393434 RepID=UPI003CF8E36E